MHSHLEDIFNEIKNNNLTGGESMNLEELKWDLVVARWESRFFKHMKGVLKTDLFREYLMLLLSIAVGAAFFGSIEWIAWSYFNEPAEITKWIMSNLLFTQIFTASFALLAPTVMKIIDRGNIGKILSLTKERAEIKNLSRSREEDCKQLEEKVNQTTNEEAHVL